MVGNLEQSRETVVLCPPKAEVTSSNLVGRANHTNSLTAPGTEVEAATSAYCPRKPFAARSWVPFFSRPKRSDLQTDIASGARRRRHARAHRSKANHPR